MRDNEQIRRLNQTSINNRLIKAMRDEDEKAMRILIEIKGADVNYSYNYETPLSIASDNGDEVILEYLLDCGANINHTYKSGDSILMGAIGNYKYNNKNIITRFFVDEGADLNIKNNENETALYIATEKEDFKLVKYLIEKGADVNISNGKDLLISQLDRRQKNLFLLYLKVGFDISTTVKSDYTNDLTTIFDYDNMIDLFGLKQAQELVIQKQPDNIPLLAKHVKIDKDLIEKYDLYYLTDALELGLI